ncbi:MAG: 6-phosphofructokinase [Bacteroidales bacterium]|nr:6-phosphofructokinase [Bacteroidales bacterium]
MKNKTIGLLTSGGDAPGMNAAIRAVTRAAISSGYNVKAIYHGYQGLINGEIEEFTTESVSGIIARGGTILKTARCDDFRTEKGRAKAYEQFKKAGMDALVCIGGNGTLTGALAFADDFGIQCIGIPATIDNDINGTDETIGYDTTLNTIMECVDKIRDTAASHERIFFVEVMGRDAGWLAQSSAIASGAEAAIVPEKTTNVDQLAQYIEKGIRKSKNSSIVIVSESPECGAMHYAERVKKEYPQFDVRVSILGHMQRGGSPSARDRILASVLGSFAVEAIKEGQHNIMVGILNGTPVYVPFAKAIQVQDKSDQTFLNLVATLSN